jgi:cell fate (sporulation/competence/biofilm development) regulator YlbF (YheA/YmcA/DUF963 family)
MRSYLMLILIVPLLLLAACNPVSEEEAIAQYCQDLESFQAALAAVRGLTTDDTVEEATVALEALDDAFDEVRSSAYTLGDVRVEELEEAYEDLDDAIRDIEEGQTITDAAASIQAEVESINALYDELYSATCA